MQPSSSTTDGDVKPRQTAKLRHSLSYGNSPALQVGCHSSLGHDATTALYSAGNGQNSHTSQWLKCPACLLVYGPAAAEFIKE